jgi:hypothetical protein
MSQNSETGSRTEPRKEIEVLDRALKELSEQEAATLSSQIQGVRAGADTSVYLTILADISARRKDLEDRRGQLSRALAETKREPREGRAVRVSADRLIRGVHDALTADVITGAEKRDLIWRVVDRVICHEDGPEVEFVPGLFAGYTLHYNKLYCKISGESWSGLLNKLAVVKIKAPVLSVRRIGAS